MVAHANGVAQQWDGGAYMMPNYSDKNEWVTVLSLMLLLQQMTSVCATPFAGANNMHPSCSRHVQLSLLRGRR